MKLRIIMIGGSKTVYFLARQFVERGDHVTIINREHDRAKELAEHTRAIVVYGEGSDVDRLEEAGARRADILLALTAHDEDNLIACQLAQKIYGVPRTMAVVNDPENEEVFQQLGITTVFSATRIIAQMIDQFAHFDDITTLLPIAQGRINVTDVRLDATSPAIGRTLQEVELTEGSLVAAILRNDDTIIPRGNTRLLVDDHLILISQPEHQERNLVVLCGEEA